MPTSSKGGHRYRDIRADAEVLQREGDADEFGDDGQEVENEQVPDAEPAPEPAEPLVDQPGVPHAGDRAEPDHHLLVDDQHRDQQQQHPQQAVAIVLPGLRVGGHPARVVVADHHDQARTGDREERHQAAAPPAPGLLADPDPPQRALDVTQVRVIEHGTGPRQRLQLGLRGLLLMRLMRRPVLLLGYLLRRRLLLWPGRILRGWPRLRMLLC